MLKTVTDAIISALKKAGVEHVCTAFDSIPVKLKGDKNGIFTVVSAGALKTFVPVYSEYTAFIPFESEAELSVIAPLSTGIYGLCCYFEDKVFPAVSEPEGISCTIKGITAGKDSNLSRLVMKIKLSVSGISRIERSR